jgi:hypothetical protein
MTRSSNAARRQQAEALVASTDGDRSALERLRREYLRRLRRASDDLAATEGLRIVDLALASVPPLHPDSAWQARVRPEQPG